MKSRYFADLPIGAPDARIDAFAAFAKVETFSAYSFVTVNSTLMRQAYEASCQRIARDGVKKMCEELDIPETPKSWRLTS